MVQLIDDVLQTLIAEKLLWLKEHPDMIRYLFKTGRRETLSKLEDFIKSSKLRVVIGYPQTQNSLPAYVIVLAPENEQPSGIGDNTGIYEYFGQDSSEEKMNSSLSGTYMNSNYRIECWSDNGDLTAYMYSILKWCLLISRKEMLDKGWHTITLSGTDLEPAPDYLPVFIYRRTVQISVTYEMYYNDDLESLNRIIDVIVNPDNYTEDNNGNIIDSSGNVVVDGEFTYLLRPHYYEKTERSQ